MTFDEHHKTSGVEQALGTIVEEMGRKVWNAAVLACEDAAIRRYEEALEDDFLPGAAFDEAMETVRQLEAE